MKDLKNHIDPTIAIAPVSVTGATTGVTIDKQGAESVTFVVSLGAVAAADGSNYLTFTMQHGDASDMSDAATVSASDLLGEFVDVDDTGLAGSVLCTVGYRGTKRYCRLMIAETGAASAIVGAVAILGHLWVSPAA